jgi:hypothetical protein
METSCTISYQRWPAASGGGRAASATWCGALPVVGCSSKCKEMDQRLTDSDESTAAALFTIGGKKSKCGELDRLAIVGELRNGGAVRASLRRQWWSARS